MQWRYRGYGSGQVLLLVNNKLMFVMTEQGEVAMVEAEPGKHVEIGRVKGIEGKTWNHPVLSRGRLLVRNIDEAACFDLR